MEKKLSRTVLVIACLVFGLLITSCPLEYQFGGDVQGPHGDYFTGHTYGVARGFNAEIRVDLHLANGIIYDAAVEKVRGAETTGWWEEPFRLAPLLIVQTNSVELDGMGGPTVRSTIGGIRNAGRAAIARLY
jgi:hypothetical protein